MVPNLSFQPLLSRVSRPVIPSVPGPKPRSLVRFIFRKGNGSPETGPHAPPGPSLPRRISSARRRTSQSPTLPSSGTCQLRSGSSGLFVATSLVVLFSLVYCQLQAPPASESAAEPAPSHLPVEPAAMATADVAAGRPGNLTPEQEEKLQRLWSLLFRVFGTDDVNGGGVEAAESIASSEQTAAQPEKAKKKKGLFSRKNTAVTGSDPSSPGGPTAFEPTTLGAADPDDKYGQAQQFLDTLASQSPESIRETMWSMVKHDNPDALLLRFLRARKWDADKALHMLISTMNWRATVMHVDDDIMKNGEGGAAEAEKGQDAAAKTLAHGFLAQIRMGKSFLHGVDKAGRPICFVRVRLHRQGEQSEEALERYTVYIIETARMLLKPPVDTAVSRPGSGLPPRRRLYAEPS